MRTPSQTGFTLIELLVVISILALLAAMLLPAIVGVQRQARMTADMNNAKQLVTTVLGYRNEHGGTWPAGPGLTIANDGLVTANPAAAGDATAEAGVTAHVWYHLAATMDIAPGSFNSPAAPSDSVTTLALVEDWANNESPIDWSGTGDRVGTDYSLDWAARQSAGSVRVVIANRHPHFLGTDQTNVVFADGHTETFEVEDGPSAVNPALPDNDIYDATDGADKDNDKWARGHTRFAWVK